jgi:methionyl-tRNA formyltransferase
VKPGVTYDYASGDLLESRNTYFYTGFRGREFLAAWRDQRSNSVADGSGRQRAGSGPQNAEPTQQLLESICLGLMSQAGRPDALQLLERLLQRFEVTKRLHGEYNADWRPTDPHDYRAVERYVRFAEVLDLAYAQTSRLQFLNALLKCMDTLTSMAARLDPLQRDRLRQLSISERAHVERLICTVEKSDTSAGYEK